METNEILDRARRDIQARRAAAERQKEQPWLWAFLGLALTPMSSHRVSCVIDFFNFVFCFFEQPRIIFRHSIGMPNKHQVFICLIHIF